MMILYSTCDWVIGIFYLFFAKPFKSHFLLLLPLLTNVFLSDVDSIMA